MRADPVPNRRDRAMRRGQTHNTDRHERTGKQLKIIILFQADDRNLVLIGSTIVLSIASLSWRLYPLIRRLDQADRIDPKYYPTVLGWMMSAIILVFLTATEIFIR